MSRGGGIWGKGLNFSYKTAANWLDWPYNWILDWLFLNAKDGSNRRTTINRQQLTESEVITRKSQTALMSHQVRGLRFLRNDRTGEVNKLFIIWPFLALFLQRISPVPELSFLPAPYMLKPQFSLILLTKLFLLLRRRPQPCYGCRERVREKASSDSPPPAPPRRRQRGLMI